MAGERYSRSNESTVQACGLLRPPANCFFDASHGKPGRGKNKGDVRSLYTLVLRSEFPWRVYNVSNKKTGHFQSLCHLEDGLPIGFPLAADDITAARARHFLPRPETGALHFLPKE